MKKIDTKGIRRPFRDHADERLRARWWFDGISQHADTARIGDRGHERRIRDEPHPGADERIAYSVLAREPRIQGQRGTVGRVPQGGDATVVG